VRVVQVFFRPAFAPKAHGVVHLEYTIAVLDLLPGQLGTVVIRVGYDESVPGGAVASFRFCAGTRHAQQSLDPAPMMSHYLLTQVLPMTQGISAPLLDLDLERF